MKILSENTAKNIQSKKNHSDIINLVSVIIKTKPGSQF